ncbi:Zinc transporter 5 [Tetrabaena socialis]|uniref:Zinc transporter 5 n=1 Tax=Tetrabaena socialis TaxID=47790 RepID=A0A2J8ABC7_9CHLO|nr:Zinc transporter 5 [Tetrabaena socialis]|eukprot:PNH09829.1 Zinc transporter 5 [Tetrabaena socialis]
MAQAFRDQNNLVAQVAQSLAAGVILALGLVHLVPEAVAEMWELEDTYPPLGGVAILLGVMFMIFMEHLSHMLNRRTVARPHPVGGSGDSSCRHSLAAAKHHGAHPDPESALAATHPEPLALKAAPAGPDAEPGSEFMSTVEGGAVEYVTPGHVHGCVTLGSGPSLLLLAGPEATESLRLRALAYMFELGCVVHSIIIGISLGVSQDAAEVRALFIALCFHQWLEGLGLGSTIVRGGFTTLRAAAMVAIYSLTCPVGIAIGIALAGTYDPESVTARAVQGSLNGISGGMLIYIALVQLVAEDMGRLAAPGSREGVERMISFLSFSFGAGSMCLLAVWA